MNASNGAAPARAGSADGNMCAYLGSWHSSVCRGNGESLTSQISTGVADPLVAAPSTGRGHLTVPHQPAAGFNPQVCVTPLYPVPVAIPGAPEWHSAVEAWRAAA